MLREALPISKELNGLKGSRVAQVMLQLAAVLAREKRMTEAESVRTGALRLAAQGTDSGTPERADLEYGSACVLALEGAREAALNTLASALDHRLSAETAEGIADDSDFESLQHDPRFKALVARARGMSLAAEGARKAHHRLSPPRALRHVCTSARRSLAASPPFVSGDRHDAKTDLFQNWNRFYDPAAGRYLARAPDRF